MMSASRPTPLIAVACGGTGGHFFPGLALAEELSVRGCEVLLLVSPKEIDQQVGASAVGMSIATLPAVAWKRGETRKFFGGLRGAWRKSRELFRERRPAAVISMGGFTGVAPVFAAWRGGSATFLHEANSIPGRANRWLAHLVQEAFVFFPEAAGRLSHPQVRVTGMPVRLQFQPGDPEPCRAALGLHPRRPVLLVTGGSQGATPLNEAMLAALPELRELEPDLQYLHLTGPADVERVRSAYAGSGARAIVRPFLTEMELALGAAAVVLGRAGASSLAELAAMRIPAVLVPYPAAADNHQYYNARAFADSGAARLLEQRDAQPARLIQEIRGLLRDETRLHGMRTALRQWFFADAAQAMADQIVRGLPQWAGRPLAAPTVTPPPRPRSRPAVAPFKPVNRA